MHGQPRFERELEGVPQDRDEFARAPGEGVLAHSDSDADAYAYAYARRRGLSDVAVAAREFDDDPRIARATAAKIGKSKMNFRLSTRVA